MMNRAFRQNDLKRLAVSRVETVTFSPERYIKRHASSSQGDFKDLG